MKKYNIALLVGMLCILFACSEDYESPFPATEVTWYTSQPQLKTHFVTQYEMMGFMDASQGELSHRWEIKEGSHFLTSDVEKGDSLALFIDHETGLVSHKEGVNVYFEKSGRQTVRLYNTFPTQVSFNGAVPCESVQLEDGTWAIDKSFTVDVYEPLKAAFKVCRVVDNEDGEPTAGEVLVEVGPDRNPMKEDPSEWNSVTVEVGERLMFVDLTCEPHEELENPNEHTWTIFNQEEASVFNDSIAIVYYNKIGFTKSGLGNLKSVREGKTVPYSASQKQIPLNITVIESKQPFTYADGAMWTSPTSLVFNVSGEIASIGANVKDNFTVHVVNKELKLDKNIAVTNVTFDASNSTELKLELAEPIYTDDVVTVAHTLAGEPIKSTDKRPLVSFDPQTIAYPADGENILKDKADWAGFEKKGLASYGYVDGYWVSGNNEASQTWVRTADDGVAPVGDAYMKYTGPIQNPYALNGMFFGANVDSKVGAYRVCHRIFIEEGSTIEVLKTDIARQNTDFATDVTLIWNLKDVPRNKWVTISQLAYFPAAYNMNDGKKVRYAYYVTKALNPGVDESATQVFYLDDMQLLPVASGKRPVPKAE